MNDGTNESVKFPLTRYEIHQSPRLRLLPPLHEPERISIW
jgi:hypothetical protein